MQDSRPLRRSRIVLVIGLGTAFTAALFLPMLSPSEVNTLVLVARDIAIGVVTISAFWFGMLFGVAIQCAEEGRTGGASGLVLQLLRPVKAAGLTLLGALLAAAVAPSLDRLTLSWPSRVLQTRGYGFVALLLCVGAFYALLLALASIQHIVHVLRTREAEADAQPAVARTAIHDAAHSAGKQGLWR